MRVCHLLDYSWNLLKNKLTVLYFEWHLAKNQAKLQTVCIEQNFKDA